MDTQIDDKVAVVADVIYKNSSIGARECLEIAKLILMQLGEIQEEEVP